MNLENSKNWSVKEHQPKEKFDLTANPVGTSLRYSYQLPENTKATISIFDNMGKLIYTERLDFSMGLTTISVANQATGIYHIRMEGDNGFIKAINYLKK